MKKVRTYYDLPAGTRSDIAGQLAAQVERLRRRLESVRHTFAVLSGKGGVGKSLVTANLAAALADRGFAVGVVDADLNGPSMAKLLGAGREPLEVVEDAVRPALGAAGVKVMSMDLLLEGEEAPVNWTGPLQESFIWRGTLEANALREFLSDTEWGELDYLILDLPPGTDRVIPVHGLLADLGGVVLVTLPSELSRFIVSKSLTMSRELGIPVIGYVENMSGYVCPNCERVGPLFESDGSSFELEKGVPQLAEIPFDPIFGRETESGRPGVLACPESRSARALQALADRVLTHFEGKSP
ncbi:MAG: Mrp/NBP35 family ATP-binding protein [Candidatus Palauibacterales bacterium]|nr:Mrp/NBP35 family ATP-binding protein [Candidatus Palauibacterales bacterium]